jgi:hypothetical protein
MSEMEYKRRWKRAGNISKTYPENWKTIATWRSKWEEITLTS